MNTTGTRTDTKGATMTTHCSLCTRPVDPQLTDQGYTVCCNEPVCYGGDHRGCEIGRDETPTCDRCGGDSIGQIDDVDYCDWHYRTALRRKANA